MAQKPAAKIDDVKRPEKVTPAASGRPLIVTNRPILSSDPMVVPAADQTEAPKPAEPITRTAKTIQPVSDAQAAQAEKPAEPVAETPAEQPAAEAPAEPAVKAPETPSAPEPPQPPSEAPEEPKKEDEHIPVAIITEPSQPGPLPDPRVSTGSSTSSSFEPAAPSGVSEGDPGRDSAAEASAEETAALEAKAAREQELEQLMVSGKYHLPINAVQRKRSRIFTVLLLLLVLGLAAVLVDAALDAGLVNAPMNVPHTHFFSGTH